MSRLALACGRRRENLEIHSTARVRHDCNKFSFPLLFSVLNKNWYNSMYVNATDGR